VLSFTFFYPSQFVEIADLARDLNRQLRGIEASDAAHAAGSGEDRLRECLVAVAIRADCAHTCDDDSSRSGAHVCF
jgi:hypothetical protein